MTNQADTVPAQRHVLIHCHTCHEEWYEDEDCTCPCPPALEVWHEGRANRLAFYSRPLWLPCTEAALPVYVRRVVPEGVEDE